MDEKIGGTKCLKYTLPIVKHFEVIKLLDPLFVWLY